MVVRFPELVSLVNRVKSLPELDRVFYRDNLAMMFLISTSNNDGEVLGALQRISYKLNKELDKLNERKAVE